MVYNSTESWKLSLLMKRVLNGTLKLSDEDFVAEECSDTLEQLINGFPPIQVVIHNGVIYSSYFNMLYEAITGKHEVSIEVHSLKVYGGWELCDVEPDEIMIPAEELMDTVKFLEATKGLDKKTIHKLSMMVTKIYETVLPVVIVDDNIKERALIQYLNEWFQTY